MAASAISRLTVAAALSCTALHGQAQLALVGATIYLSPAEAPIANGLILIKGARIAAVGDSASIEIPAAARSIDCTGLTITAGFWNSHVHLFERKWENAGAIPGPELAGQLAQMFTRFGFTNVFDLGSPGENTRRIHDRIHSGEVPGPNIRSTGEPLIAPEAMPSPKALKRMGFISFLAPEIRSARQAAAAVGDLLDAGADGIKLHLQPPPAPGPGFPRRAIRVAVRKAHLRGKPVFSHPHNGDDVLAALRAGVDVIAHTTPDGGEWDRSVLPPAGQSGTALTPTLALWKYSVRRESASTQQRVVGAAVGQLRSWIASEGAVLFGTDAGAIGYDPSDEYALMAQAGMSFRQILASLTTTPADRFGDSDKLGRIAPGFQADLVVLEGDPTKDIEALADVKYTVRGGKIIFSADD